jgi:hypothetical protein
MSISANSADLPHARRPALIYWWAFPSRLALFVHLPIFLLCSAMDESDYAIYKHSVKHLNDYSVMLGVAAILCFALFSALFEPRRADPDVSPVPAKTVDAALSALFTIVLIAYAIFLLPIIFNLQLMLDLLQGSTTAMYGLRETLNRIPGVTTLMSLQSLLAVLLASYTALTGRRLSLLYRRLAIMVVIACLLRGWLWSERLALIELALPAVVVIWAKISPEWQRRSLRPLAFAPLLAVLLVFCVFALGEFFRSWQYYQYQFSGSFLEFIVVRFAGYYATALNNGSALCSLVDAQYMPTATAEWFYRFPLWQFVAEHKRPYPFNMDDFLDAYMNREFNNMSGIFMPIFDYGPYLGLLCWAILGAITGSLFNGFARGQVGGLLLFPAWFTGVIEILRVFYWGDSRFFPVIVGAAILTWYMRRRTTQTQPLRQVSASAIG